MAVCQLCGNKFLRLQDGMKCRLCQLRLPGLSSPELQAINVSSIQELLVWLTDLHLLLNKPQCVACGIASNLLENPICNGCITHYSKSQTHAGLCDLAFALKANFDV
jgi:hypothetical protein